MTFRKSGQIRELGRRRFRPIGPVEREREREREREIERERERERNQRLLVVPLLATFTLHRSQLAGFTCYLGRHGDSAHATNDSPEGGKSLTPVLNIHWKRGAP